MNPQKRYEIFTRLREHIKAPRSELEYRSNFELLNQAIHQDHRVI
jgi:endonuclease III